MEPEVFFRHDDWVVLIKPHGYSVQDLAESYKPFFESFHPVHRLDKETSGLWLIATNAESNKLLSHSFQDRLIKKAYLAITHKKPKHKQGEITGDMVKSRRGQWKLLKTTENPAVTHFRSIGLADGKRLVICMPVTGKTHQIRVAMKSLGSPVLGDRLYDAADAEMQSRLFLHAFYLAFEWAGEVFRFCKEPAWLDDFGKFNTCDMHTYNHAMQECMAYQHAFYSS